jgi:SHS2 domain-containing protein
MSYAWAEHTGELELRVEAASPEAVLADALAALGELLGEGEAGTPDLARESRRLDLEGADRAVLLADWLAELAFLAETEGFVPDAVEALALRPDGLSARVAGRRARPPHLVKAVTYHRLAFEPAGAGWRGVAVLDV